MIERFRLWLRDWLQVLSIQAETVDALANMEVRLKIAQNEIKELRAEVTRLSIAQYVPPSTPDPKKKIVKTQTFKQFTDILEQEQEQQENVDALR